MARVSAQDGFRQGSPRACAVATRLADLISNGRYHLHQRLPPERQLCQEFGVTRGVLRKGLSILADEGLIWRHVGKGTYVGGGPISVVSCSRSLGSQTTLSDLLEARLFIEPFVARLAADRASKRDLALMERYHENAAEVDNWDAWDGWDELFHRSLAESCGNTLLISFTDSLFQMKRISRWSIRRAQKFYPDLRETYTRHHANILFHVSKRDALRAEEAMRYHLSDIANHLGPTLRHSRPISASSHSALCPET